MARSLTGDAKTTTIWRRLDTPGHDVCHLIRRGSGWALEGSAVFLHEQAPCALHYSVTCDHAFQTLNARVRGWLGRKPFTVNASRDARNQWRVNGAPAPAVRGCVDIDINFSPATNLLSLRRLRPRRDKAITVRAAWLAFPEVRLTALEQVYMRTSATTYDYSAPALDFSSRLVVDRHGMVLEYPPLWKQQRRVDRKA